MCSMLRTKLNTRFNFINSIYFNMNLYYIVQIFYEYQPKTKSLVYLTNITLKLRQIKIYSKQKKNLLIELFLLLQQLI